MKSVRIFFTLSSALIVAATVFGVSAGAKKSSYDQCIEDDGSKAECACEFALQKGTKSALQEFLRLYRNADTACNATASTAEFNDSNGGLGGSSGGGSSNGGSSNGGSSSGGSSSGGSSSGGNPGNDKPVGNAGESPNGSDFGDGVKGKSQ